ncbi:hypothetical protein PRIPAC_73657, partial [Pristionchus pacificus]
HIYSCGDGSRQRSPSVDRLNDKRFAPSDSDLPPDALPQDGRLWRRATHGTPQ